MKTKKENNNFEREAEALVSAVHDFAKMHNIGLFMVLGDLKCGFSAYRGNLGIVAPVMCSAATDSIDIYEAVTTAARLLSVVKKQGFDFDAVHEGTSSSTEQFDKINKKGRV